MAFTRLLPCTALLVIPLLACDGQTGLLIEVDRIDRSEELSSLDTLEFYIGTDSDPGTDVYLPDPEQRRVELDGGRDLRDDPYRLLLQVGDFGALDPFNTDVVVAVVASREGEATGFGVVGEPVRFVDDEVRKYSITLDRDSSRVRTGVPGCTSLVVGESVIQIASPDDRDCDGALVDDDCNDGDPSIFPGATESCENEVDDDCDQAVDENTDRDADGVFSCDGDCDDNNAAVRPGLAEVCDGVDNNCDGFCDEGFDDSDGDSYLDECASVRREDGTCRAVLPPGPDCDDGSAEIHPERNDPCDGVDNDCNGICDDELSSFEDPDGDGFGNCGGDGGGGLNVEKRFAPTCVAPADCAPEDFAVHPGAIERCDGLDGDCDGDTKFTGIVSCFTSDGGSCSLGQAECTEAENGSVEMGVCTPGETAAVPADFCDGGCDEDPDALQCYLEEEDDQIELVSCRVYFASAGDTGVGSSAALCPARKVPVPTHSELEGCMWDVIDSIGPYSFGFGGPAPSVASCNISFDLVSWNSNAQGTGNVWLRGSTESSVTLYELVVSPVLVAECPTAEDGGGFQCDPPFAFPQ